MQSKLLEGKRNYKEYTKKRNPLTKEAESFWREEETMLKEFSERFQRDGCISNKFDLKCLTRWKWPGLWANHAKQNSESELKEVTGRAFSLNPTNEIPSDDVVREQVEILRDLRGIATATATVLLTFWKPDIYTVMDVRALRTLADHGLWDKSPNADTEEYPDYLQQCHSLAEQFGLNLRDVDRALWSLGEGGH